MVTSIELDTTNQKYIISYNQKETEEVDYVILATPLELGNIKFGPNLDFLNSLDKRTFITVHKTFL